MEIQLVEPKDTPHSCCVKLNGANLRLRVMSSVVLAPLVLLCVYQGGILYNLVVAVVMLLGAVEWLRMTDARTRLEESSLLRKAAMAGFVVPYLGGCWLALAYLRNVPEKGMALIFYLLAVVWATDIGAFLAGRLIGGPKVCPSISPKKTWAGLIGGMVLAALIGYGVARGFEATQPCMAAGLAVVLAVVAQAGDFFESWVKRRAGVKDSGTLIPGHGGILDRIDGLIFAAVFLALFRAVATKDTSWW